MVVTLELLEGHNTVLRPFESFPFVDQEIERSTSIRRPRNKSIQGSDYSSKLLDHLGVLRWFWVINGLDLVRVNLYSPMSNHVS